MGYTLIKTLVSALIITLVSEVAKRSPALAALIASLPLVSVLGMIWIYQETHDIPRIAAHSTATFWFVLPSLPMFLLLPYMLRHEWPFWASLLAGSALTILLYLAMSWLGPRVGIRL